MSGHSVKTRNEALDRSAMRLGGEELSDDVEDVPCREWAMASFLGSISSFLGSALGFPSSFGSDLSDFVEADDDGNVEVSVV